MQIILNLMDGLGCLLFSCHEEVGWINLIVGENGDILHGHGIKFLYTVDFIVPKGDSHHSFGISWGDIYRVALHPKGAAQKFDVITEIECLNEFAKEVISAYLLSTAQ